MNNKQFEPKMQAPLPDREAIESFLSTTICDAFHLAYIPDGEAPICKWFGNDAASAADWAVAANEREHNVYFTFNRVPAGLDRKPSASDILAARFAFADIDPPKDGQPFDMTARIEALQNDRCPPSFVIASGGGLQAYWRIEESENLAAIGELGRGIAHKLTADSCANVDRLARLPGTVNYPNEAKRTRGRAPSLAYVEVADTGELYEPSELAAHFPTPVSNKAARAKVALPENIEPLTLDAMGLSDSFLQQAINHPKGVDRSADTYHATAEMVRCGFSDAQIASILLNPANPISAHCLDQSPPVRAATNVIGKARADEGIAEGAMLFIGKWQAMTDALAANWERKHGKGLHANDNQIGIVQALPVMRFCDIQPVLEGQWLIKRFLPAEGFTVMHGHPGCGKSFLALDIALSVAEGRDWNGRKVQQGFALYIAAEGALGLQNRVAAYREAQSEKLNLPFGMIKCGVDLQRKGADIERVAKSIEAECAHYRSEPKLIVIDTLSKTFGAGKENTDDMAQYVANCADLASRFSANTMVLHHRPKDSEQSDPRGHSSLKGGADAVLLVKAGSPRSVTVQKQKDGPDGETIFFNLQSIELGHDEDGDPVTSCVVQYIDQSPLIADTGFKGHRKLVFEALERAIAEAGETLPADPDNVCHAAIMAVKVEQWSDNHRQEAERTGGQKPDSVRRTFVREKNTLTDGGFVRVSGDFAWIPE